MARGRQRRVRKAFDAAALARVCALQDFSEYGERYELGQNKWGDDRFFYFKNNGSRILATAHLDSVQTDSSCQVMRTINGPLAVSPVLDDRLGAYVILELLPKLGVTVDWLLTTGEETGDSTAADFTIDKQYNWMFSFDRAGTDVVLYEYDTCELRDLVEDAGARVGRGSFSDISYLEHLGCAGMNWGVGYEDYHSMRSHAWLADTFSSVGRFLRFFGANVDTLLPHEERPKYEQYTHHTGVWQPKGRSFSQGEWQKYIDDGELPPERVAKDFDWPQDCPACWSVLDDGWCESCGEDWHRALDAEFNIHRDTPPFNPDEEEDPTPATTNTQEVPA